MPVRKRQQPESRRRYWAGGAAANIVSTLDISIDSGAGQQVSVENAIVTSDISSGGELRARPDAAGQIRWDDLCQWRRYDGGVAGRTSAQRARTRAYKEAFGLSDNPFGPRRPVGTLPPNLTVAPEKQPLLLHRDAKLDQLYCDKISLFRAACEDLQTLLEADGYSMDPLGRGVSSYLVAIEGDRGAGKTTLASRMLQLVRKRSPVGEPAWQTEEVLLKSMSQTVTEQVEKLKVLETKVGTAKAAYLCVLIDDLLADAYPYAAELYDNLRNDSAVFMVFTSCDPHMAAQIDKTLHSVQRFSIAPLTPDDAIAYVNARYQIFRMPSPNGLNSEPLFPFDEKDIRTAVAVRVLSGAATTGPVNLRLVASVLQSALANRLQEIARQSPGFDVHAVPAGKLTVLKIKVAQAYKIVVRT
jgi:hypothetical protein